MRVGNDLLLTGLCRRGGPARPRADAAHEAGQFRRVSRWRFRVELQIARDARIASAEFSKARGVLMCLREAKIDPPEHLRRRFRRPPASRERFFRESRVYRNEWDSLLLYRVKNVRPDFGFRDQDDLGPPIVEKTQRVLMNIERKKLMKATLGQALAQHAGRAERAARHDNMKTSRNKFLHARQERQAFADARTVHPCHASAWTRQTCDAEALLHARRIFLAAPNAHPEQKRHERPASGRETSIGEKRERALHQLSGSSSR